MQLKCKLFGHKWYNTVHIAEGQPLGHPHCRRCNKCLLNTCGPALTDQGANG